MRFFSLMPFVIAYGTVLLCLASAAFADEAMQQSEQRLVAPDGLVLEQFSSDKPKSLQQSAEEWQAEQNDNNKEIKIDLQQSLQPFKEPEHDGISPSLKDLPGRQLSIQSVRALALQNNLSIQVARFDPEIAAQTLREEEAKFDRILFAYAKYAVKDTPSISGDNVEFTAANPALNKQQLKLTTLEQEKKETSLEAGIKIPLRTGGTVTVSSPFNRIDSAGLVDSDEFRSALRFSFSQPLLRNAGRDVNEASIRIADYSQVGEQLKTRLQVIRVISLIDKAYWDLYKAWGMLDVRRQQYEYAHQNLLMVKRRVKEGLTARVEINRAEIGVTTRLDALVVAKTKVKLAQRQLQFLLNDLDHNQSETFNIIPVTEPNLLKFSFQRDKLINDAMTNRIDLLNQELKLSADLVKIDYLENQTLPMFTLDYQYGALSNTEDSFGNTYQDLFNGDFNDWSIGLKFEMPLTNEARKARLQRAVSQRLQRLTTKTLQTLTVKREIHDALDYVDQNWQRILIARQQVLIAGMNYEAELKQFNEGLRTMTEVLETLTRLGEAQVKEVRAISDYQISLIDAAYATGTTLGYSQIELN